MGVALFRSVTLPTISLPFDTSEGPDMVAPMMAVVTPMATIISMSE